MSQPPAQRNPKLIALSGDCRALLTQCQSGNQRASCVAFARLTQLLLNATVLEPGQFFPPLQKTPPSRGEADGAYALGRPGQLLRLNNGSFLRLLLTFRVEPSVSADGAPKLKTLSSSIQYQLRANDDNSWVFRYEYFRHAPTHYAPGHLHVRGLLPTHNDAGKRSLDDVHFPTGRVTLEAIIRLLVDDFDVPTNEDEGVWRPLLHETEATFIKIARQPIPRHP